MRVDTAAKTAKNATEKAARAAEKAAKSSEKAAQSNAVEESVETKKAESKKQYAEYVGENLKDWAVDKSVEYADNDEKNQNKSEYDATVRGLRAVEHIKTGKDKSKYKDAAVDAMKFVSDEAKRTKKGNEDKKK